MCPSLASPLRKKKRLTENEKVGGRCPLLLFSITPLNPGHELSALSIQTLPSNAHPDKDPLHVPAFLSSRLPTS